MCHVEGNQNPHNPNKRSFGQGGAKRRNYKQLKLGDGQAYDHSND
jgi:hypothetical protein